MHEITRSLDPAFHAYNSTRKRTLVLHPGVRETLDLLAKSGIKLVAHTESKLYSIVTRFRLLGLTDYFSKIYCRERSVSQHLGSGRSEEHTSELQSLMRISYAVFCLQKKRTQHISTYSQCIRDHQQYLYVNN